MADKESRLSITLRAIDKATGPLRAVGSRIATLTAPVRELGAKLSGLATQAGLPKLVAGFHMVGGVVKDLAGKVLALGGVIGGLVGGAVAGLVHITNQFDELGDAAEVAGVDVDWLAGMRDAAERSGSSIEKLDAGMKNFAVGLGKARAGSGALAGLLGNVGPALLRQVKAAKSNAAAFDLIADAMSKLKDPAKRAALAQAAFGDASLAPMLAKDSKGLAALREQFTKRAGSMKPAVDAAGEFDAAMKDVNASVTGVKAALVTGLTPALTVMAGKASAWLTDNRERIAAWALELGQKLPGVVEKVGKVLGKVWDKISAAAGFIQEHWEPISGFFETLWDTVTTIVQTAWKVITKIVDEVKAAVAWIEEKLNWITDKLGGELKLTANIKQQAAEDDKARDRGRETIGGIADALGSQMEKMLQARSSVENTTKALAQRPDVSPKAREAVSNNRARQVETMTQAMTTARPESGAITVDFKNVPRGVSVRPQGSLPEHVEVNVGNQMYPGFGQ